MALLSALGIADNEGFGEPERIADNEAKNHHQIQSCL
jgi:hypothetical protein